MQVRISNKTGQQLMQTAAALPICDYHCHLSPREIYEDCPFENIGQIWLAQDHYKWRLMRTAGVPERLITGDAEWQEKFAAFAAAIERSPGNPLYLWCHDELQSYFGITTPLRADTAQDIWQQANRVITEQRLSPRALIERSNVQFIATTDDPADPLEWHERIAADSSISVRVTPSFRCDRVLLCRAADYAQYIERLGRAADTKIDDLAGLRRALQLLLERFKRAGCCFSDLGIADFPDRIADDNAADRAFRAALSGAPLQSEDYLGFLGNMMVWLAGEYHRRGIVQQLHLAVRRNVNSSLLRECGVDAGGDCVADAVSGGDLCALLDAMHSGQGLPETILYSLNPAANTQLATIAGSFRGVYCGAAWWFCDHRRGIRSLLETVAEQGCIGAFPGMLTDSRSFLSYARHGYFRRIVCELIGEWVEAGEYDAAAAPSLVRAICYDNTRRMCKIEEGAV